MPTGVGTALAIGGAVAGVAGNVIGARAQENDLTSAQTTQRKYLDLLSGFKDTVYGGTDYLRAATKKLLPGLMGSVTSPTTSEGYKIAMKEGLDLISGNAAVSGDPNSGPAQIAKGKFGANLAASETDRIMDNIFKLIGFTQSAGQQGTATAANLLTGMASPYQNISDLYAAKGENTGALWGSLGQTGMQAGLLGGKQLGLFGGF